MMQEKSREVKKRKWWRLSGNLGVDLGLHGTSEERAEHLKAVMEFLQNEKVWALHAWLHENLTILDNKANAILAVNSIALATLTIFYATLDMSTLAIVKIGFLIPFSLLLWSIIPLARIAFVYWSTTGDFRSPDEMLDALLQVRDVRSKIIRASILKAAVAFCIFALVLALDAIAGMI